MKPFLKCLGGKRKYLDLLRSHMPTDYKRYVEPFLGGGALFFNIQPKTATIGDLNADMINVLVQIKNRPEQIMDVLINHIQKDSEKYYYKVRSKDPEEMHPYDAAARYIYLNKTCYSGNMRYNSDGKLNIPYAKYKNPSFPTEADFYQLQGYLQSVKNLRIVYGDFELICKHPRAKNFYYFDPPYYHPDTGFVSYHRSKFTDHDQIRLKTLCDKLTKVGCYVMVTNSDFDWVKDLYKDYRIEPFIATRACNSDPSARSGVTELIITNEYIRNCDV